MYHYAHEFPRAKIIWHNEAVRVIFIADGSINYQLVGTGQGVVLLADGVVGGLTDLHSEGELLTSRNTIYIVYAIKPVAVQRFVLVTSPKKKNVIKRN